MRDNTPRLAGPGQVGLPRNRRRKMNTNRRIAVVAGVAVPHCDGCRRGLALVSTDPECSGLPHQDLGQRETRSSLERSSCSSGPLRLPGIALALYPVLRKHNEGLALGSVGFRTHRGRALCSHRRLLLMLVTLSQEAANAGTPASSAYEVPGCAVDGSTVIRWARSRAAGLWPRGPHATTGCSIDRDSSPDGCRPGVSWPSRWSWCPASLSCSVSSRASRRPSSSWRLPIGVQEMVLAVWLIAKGFNPRAIASAPAIAAAPAIEPSLAGARTL